MHGIYNEALEVSHFNHTLLVEVVTTPGVGGIRLCHLTGVGRPHFRGWVIWL